MEYLDKKNKIKKKILLDNKIAIEDLDVGFIQNLTQD